MAKLLRALWGWVLLLFGIVPPSMDRCGIDTGYAGERYIDMDCMLAPVIIDDIKIRENWNARKGIPEDDVRGLNYSMADVGQLNVISVVRRSDGKFDLIAGEKRLLAARMAKRRTIDARIFEELTAEQELRIMLDENLVRVPLNVIEEAEAFARLGEYKTEDQVASLYRRSTAYVRERLDLLKLPRDVQRMMLRPNNPLRIHQAGLLTTVNNPSLQIQLAREVAMSVGTANMSENDLRSRIREVQGERNLPLETQERAPRVAKPKSKAARRTRPSQETPPVGGVASEPVDAENATTAPTGAPAGHVSAQLFGYVEIDGDAVYLSDVSLTVADSGRQITFQQKKLFLDLSADNRELVTECAEQGVPA